MRSRTSRRSLSVVFAKLVVVAAALAGAAGSAAQDEPYVCDGDVVASFGQGRYTDIEVRGHVAYCTYEYGLVENIQLFDVSDPLNGVLLSTIDVASQRFQFDGDRIYIETDDGIVIYDVADPASPLLLGSLDVDPYEFAAEGDRLYISSSSDIPAVALRIYDVSDPSDIVQIGDYTPGADLEDNSVFAVGEVVVLGNRFTNSPLYVADLSDPSAPVSLGTIDQDGTRIRAMQDGSLLYVTHFGSAEIYDLAGGAPVALGDFEFESRFTRFSLHGDFFGATDDNMMIVWDVSDPALPVFGGEYEARDDIEILDAEGDRALVEIDYTGIAVLDLSAPPKIGLIGLKDAIYEADCYSLLGGYIASSNDNGVQLVDPLLDPLFPLISDEEHVGPDRSSYIKANYADGFLYAGGGSFGGSLDIFDVSDPTEPAFVHTILGNFADYRFDGDLLVTRYDTPDIRDAFFLLYDVSDHTDPVFVEQIDTAPFKAFDVEDGLVVVSNGSVQRDLDVFDVSNPSQPALVGSYQFEDGYHWAARIAIADGYAFTMYSDDTMRVLDISDPSNPTLVSSSAPLDTLVDSDSIDIFEINDGVLYVVDSRDLYLLDVSDPTAPALVGHYEAESSIMGMDIVDDRVWLTVDHRYGLVALDVSDPSDPVHIATREFPTIAFYATMPIQVDEQNEVAFLVDQQLLLVVDISTPCARDCPADVNGDGTVTPTDFTAWVDAFNNNSPECDQNGDGDCTPTDFTAWITNFNLGCD